MFFWGDGGVGSEEGVGAGDGGEGGWMGIFRENKADNSHVISSLIAFEIHFNLFITWFVITQFWI